MGKAVAMGFVSIVEVELFPTSPAGGINLIRCLGGCTLGSPTTLDLDAKDRERLNSGIQSVLVKNAFHSGELVARIRRFVHPAQSSHS